MSGIEGWAIPSIGPSFGRAMDQAPILRRHRFPTAMALPCGDPRDARGLEAGLREIASAAGIPLVLYLKSEDGFGSDLMAGLDAVARLVADRVCVAIKYAVVRTDPGLDPYLTALLERVDRRLRRERHRRAARDRAHERLRAAGLHDRIGLPRAVPDERALQRLHSRRLARCRGAAEAVPAARRPARRLGAGARAARGARARRGGEDGADPAVRERARAGPANGAQRPSRASCCA